MRSEAIGNYPSRAMESQLGQITILIGVLLARAKSAPLMHCAVKLREKFSPRAIKTRASTEEEGISRVKTATSWVSSFGMEGGSRGVG